MPLVRVTGRRVASLSPCLRMAQGSQVRTERNGALQDNTDRRKEEGRGKEANTSGTRKSAEGISRVLCAFRPQRFHWVRAGPPGPDSFVLRCVSRTTGDCAEVCKGRHLGCTCLPSLLLASSSWHQGSGSAAAHCAISSPFLCAKTASLAPEAQKTHSVPVQPCIDTIQCARFIPARFSPPAPAARFLSSSPSLQHTSCQILALERA
jgi:hypothetical protein